MNRSLLSTFVILPIALWTAFVGNAEANNCGAPVAISAGTIAWAWGFNGAGQLGDGTTTNRSRPVQVEKLSGLTAVAGGGPHSLALTTDRTVWAWGSNDHGELGDGTIVTRTAPVQVQNLSGAAAIDGGGEHSLGLKSDGTVWAWGRNSEGQLGDGTGIERHTPVQVQNLTGATAIAAGLVYNLALKGDGTVWAWGVNGVGQLGDGTTIERHTPVQVQDLSGVVCIAAGGAHSLAVKNDGTVWTWGANDHGQLGDGTTANRHTPVQVTSLSGVTGVAGGGNYSLALKSDGTVWAWGGNDHGQLGDSTTIERHTPVQTKNLSGVVAVAAGPNAHSLALSNAAPPVGGIVHAWGWNILGELGDGTAVDRPLPVRVATLSGVQAIASGNWHSLALAAPGVFLNVRDILVHPDTRHLRLFNLRIDGVVVRANDNGGNTGFQLVSPGSHMVDETGGTGTPLGAFTTVLGGDCAADGTVNLAPGDRETCTITNYDHVGGCARTAICCEPGDGTQGCLACSKPGKGCPGQ